MRFFNKDKKGNNDKNKLTQRSQRAKLSSAVSGVCNYNPETVVLAHIRIAGITGAGQKAPDQLGAWACSACHDAIDLRTKTDYSRDELLLAHLEGMARTQSILISEGKL